MEVAVHGRDVRLTPDDVAAGIGHRSCDSVVGLGRHADVDVDANALLYSAVHKRIILIPAVTVVGERQCFCDRIVSRDIEQQPTGGLGHFVVAVRGRVQKIIDVVQRVCVTVDLDHGHSRVTAEPCGDWKVVRSKQAARFTGCHVVAAAVLAEPQLRQVSGVVAGVDATDVDARLDAGAA
jgi:hypothetical protein